MAEHLHRDDKQQGTYPRYEVQYHPRKRVPITVREDETEPKIDQDTVRCAEWLGVHWLLGSLETGLTATQKSAFFPERRWKEVSRKRLKADYGSG